MPEMTDCKRLESATNEAGRRVIREHNEKDKRYDAETRHGRNQGAWLER
jgi:predicted secreted Zn-dependent protease